MATFPIYRGDTSPALRCELSPDTLDLTEATVTFSLRGLLSLAPATVARLQPPIVQYAWRPGDTDHDPRLYPFEFHIEFADGRTETFAHSPDGSRFAVLIRDRVTGAAVTIIEHTIGETVAEPITLTTAAGQALDLTGATVTALVETAAGTVEHPLAIHDALIGEVWPAWDTLALVPGSYPMRLRVVWPGGAVEMVDDDFRLEVTV